MHLAEHQHRHRQRDTAADQQRGGHQQDRAQRAEGQPHQQQHRGQRTPADGVDLPVGLHRGRLGVQRHARAQYLQARRLLAGGGAGRIQQQVDMALAIELERRPHRVELQHRPMLAIGLEQAVIAHPQARAQRALLPPLRPQRQRVLPPIGQSRCAHRAIQRGQCRVGQAIDRFGLQALALLAGQQAVAVRRVERARLLEPALDRPAVAQQRPALGAVVHHRSECLLGGLGLRGIGTAEQHHDLARVGIGDAAGDIGEQAIMRILRQQRQDVGIDPRLALPQLPLLHAQANQHQQPEHRQPAPDALQAAVGGQQVIQTCCPLRHSTGPGFRSCRQSGCG
ncbi:hypothetical protein D3C71_932380 [compost metagenome]